MTIKVWKEGSNHKVFTIADKGEECRIDVGVGTSRLSYGDSIAIMTHSGTVRISGNHVHELMKSILRFSSRDMLECWIHFALVTNQAAGRKEIDLNGDRLSFDKGDVDWEKENREREINFNDNYFKRNKETA